VPGRALVLVGFMGSGKSSAARTLVSGSLDSDLLIESETGTSINDLFAREGEAGFREIEERVVLAALERAGSGVGRGVISLGGGALGSARVRDALQSHTVVLLDIDVDTCWERVRGSDRPLASDRRRFGELYETRRATYSAVADAIVPADGVHVVRQALPAIEMLTRSPEGTRVVWAVTASGAYPVFVGDGLIGAELLRPEGRFALITDTNVGVIHGSNFNDPMVRIAIEPGEEAKNVATLAGVWSDLARAGMTRDDQVFALGGGVVGDLAGFAAASYQRGVPVSQFPTTLVAQVDSALGGKTGIDLPEGKNYVGAYHQPSAVVADVGTLRTLPQEELSAGMAEVIKTALISGGPLWDIVSSGEEVSSAMVLECVRTKLEVVAADERDGGRRQVLNLGHTIGHAIETASGYSLLRHGEAVSIGLMAALKLSGAEALRTQVGELLTSAGLPLTVTGVDALKVAALVSADKKARSDGTIPFVLCDRPGNATHGHTVPDADVRSAIFEVCR
jgi:shikimate kinase/3-dehydroquinate synthase